MSIWYGLLITYGVLSFIAGSVAYAESAGHEDDPLGLGAGMIGAGFVGCVMAWAVVPILLYGLLGQWLVNAIQKRRSK